MQKSYESDLANHIGPESCGAAREGGAEALTGEREGRVFCRVRIFPRDADAVGESGRLHLVHRLRIPDDADRRSGSCRSAVPIDGDQRSGMMPITDSGMIAIS